MSLAITAYLTPQQIPAVEAINRASDNATIYLMPLSVAGPALPKLITVGLLQPDGNPVGCKNAHSITLGHVWYPDPATGGDAPFIATSALVNITPPQSPYWAGAEFNPQKTGYDASLGPTPPDAPCPESKEAVLLVPKTWEVNCLPVPGEELRVTHSTYGYGSFAKSAYHTCPGLSGGVIAAKWSHPTVEGAFLYDVHVEGSLLEDIQPMDFTEFSVGDWCFLLRGDESARDMSFPATTPESPDDAGLLRVVSLQIAGVD